MKTQELKSTLLNKLSKAKNEVSADIAKISWPNTSRVDLIEGAKVSEDKVLKMNWDFQLTLSRPLNEQAERGQKRSV